MGVPDEVEQKPSARWPSGQILTNSRMCARVTVHLPDTASCVFVKLAWGDLGCDARSAAMIMKASPR